MTAVGQLQALVIRRPGSAIAWTADTRHVHELRILSLEFRKVLPEQIAEQLIQSLRRFRADLGAGALLLIEPGRSRVRVLPL